MRVAQNELKLPFNRETIIGNVPTGGGVYALFASNACLCIAHADDLRAALTESLGNGNGFKPTHFQYEIVKRFRRLHRLAELASEFRPPD